MNKPITDTSKLDEALEELVVKTANLYGGFEGFEDDDRENMQLAKNKIQAYIDRLLTEKES